MQKEIDYSPLQKLDKGQLWGRTIDMHFVALPALAVGIVLLFIAVNSATTSKPQLWVILIGLLGIFPAVWGIQLLRKLKKQDEELLAAFIQVNGWQPLSEQDTLALVPPCLIGLGHSQKSTPGIKGQYQGMIFELFGYNFLTGSGKDQTEHPQRIFAIEMDKQFTHLLLMHKRSVGQKLDGSDPFNKPSQSEKINLEGDFNNFFEVYGESDSDVPAREILTPDIMQALIEIKDNPFNLEFVGQQLYIMAIGGEFTSVNGMRGIFSLAPAIYRPLASNFALEKGLPAEAAPTSTPPAPEPTSI